MAITQKRIEHPKPDKQAAYSHTARGEASRGATRLGPGTPRRSPVAILQEQATSRVQELVPIRHARMTASANASTAAPRR